ncbi:MafI family immunity protein [Flavobacteriaceae bacterium 3-367]|uniref:MafI family immunity protein n=1 Tax=Eudoraea algarum TaxID=3417568 RepID=UPI00328B8E99
MKKELLALSSEIINGLLSRKDPFCTFEAAGIRDGLEIIHEYVANREFGVAFEHLEYIISECDISLSPAQVERLSSLAKRFK